MIGSRSLSTDDRCLLELFVLIHAARAPVSEEVIRSYTERHEMCGMPVAKIRALLSALVRQGMIQPAKGAYPGFVATRQGKKFAAEARTRLLNAISLLNDRSSR